MNVLGTRSHQASGTCCVSLVLWQPCFWSYAKMNKKCCSDISKLCSYKHLKLNPVRLWDTEIFFFLTRKQVFWFSGFFNFFFISNEDQSAQRPDFSNRSHSIFVTNLCEPECTDPCESDSPSWYFSGVLESEIIELHSTHIRFILLSPSNVDWKTVKESMLASRTCWNLLTQYSLFTSFVLVLHQCCC